MNYDMDVFYTIMEFLIPNGYLPSAALLKEYSESKVTRVLNTLPSREYFNTKFDKDSHISEERYELLRKRLESRPPFVFYFNPNIQLKEKVYESWILKIWFFAEGTDVSVNKRNRLQVYVMFVINISYLERSEFNNINEYCLCNCCLKYLLMHYFIQFLKCN